MFSSEQRVVQHEFVHRSAGIFKVKLYKLNLIREDIQRDLNALSNCNELIIRVIDCHWLKQTTHLRITIMLRYGEPARLLIQKLSDVEDRLVFLSGHAIEQVVIGGLAKHRNSKGFVG